MIRLSVASGVVSFALILLSAPTCFSGDAAKGSVAQRSDPLLAERVRHVQAITRAYGHLIEAVEPRGEDLVFRVRGREIHYQEGRMLAAENIARSSEFASIFYDYTKGAVQSMPSYVPRVVWSHDFLDALAGSSEQEVEAGSRRIFFLNRPVTVHTLCVEPLRRVDAEIWSQALRSAEVREFILRLKAIYSTKWRMVRGINNRSYHSYGLALDLFPRSYRGKHIYWQWSADDVTEWDKIPLGLRWRPPEEVIRAFEENGFVWGGKWYRFDGMHFEYRPEILLLNDGTLDDGRQASERGGRKETF